MENILQLNFQCFNHSSSSKKRMRNIEEKCRNDTLKRLMFGMSLVRYEQTKQSKPISSTHYSLLEKLNLLKGRSVFVN